MGKKLPNRFQKKMTIKLLVDLNKKSVLSVQNLYSHYL